jgi:hypothetical protein
MNRNLLSIPWGNSIGDLPQRKAVLELGGAIPHKRYETAKAGKKAASAVIRLVAALLVGLHAKGLPWLAAYGIFRQGAGTHAGQQTALGKCAGP